FALAWHRSPTTDLFSSGTVLSFDGCVWQSGLWSDGIEIREADFEIQMKTNSLIWSKRITGWVAIFFLVTATVPTLLIACVIMNGRRVEIFEPDVELRANSTLWNALSRFSGQEMSYRYEISGKMYSN